VLLQRLIGIVNLVSALTLVCQLVLR
jgi:hypothetical protein